MATRILFTKQVPAYDTNITVTSVNIVVITWDKLLCGKKGIILSNSEDIGHRVFVSDADIGTTIKTTIKEDEICPHCGKSHLGVIELPQLLV